ncbi:MAG TPA: hypothetical protein QF469_21495 [Sphingomonas sanguinis]|uniref:hypothetical protein n=1 Tax=Sphingomonas sanguinis TaxID=33051 RepID=UPI002ABFFF50|nr:hypothetical protein [Sphingomonas sanguinis]
MKKTIGVFALAAALAACGSEQRSENSTAQAREAPVGPPACDKARLAAVSYDTQSFSCPLDRSVKGTGRLVIDNIDMTLGRDLSAVVADAKKAGAKVQSGKITTLSLVTEDVSPISGSFFERRSYRLATKAGKIVGIAGCENYQSGLYRHRIQDGMVNGLGAPQKFEGGMATGYFSWPDGASLSVSGSPNIARAEIGKAPAREQYEEGFGPRVFQEVVHAEDRHPGDPDGGRTEVAMKYCMTQDELKSIMVPLLQSGMQPDEQ